MERIEAYALNPLLYNKGLREGSKRGANGDRAPVIGHGCDAHGHQIIHDAEGA